MCVRVRFAVSADQRRLAELDPWPTDRVRQWKIEAREIIVSEVDRSIVGTLRFEFIWTTVPFISFIYIDEAHRGRGVSRLMLDLLIRELKQQGYPALLSSAQTDEPAAQRWHEHIGFTTNGRFDIADKGIGEIIYRMAF